MEAKINEFEIRDIEDVRIIFKAKGKHYSITPKPEFSPLAKEIRIILAIKLLESHDVVFPALEEIKKGE